MIRLFTIFALATSFLCAKPLPEIGLAHVNPRFITDPVRYDSDDIQIWIHPDNPGGSLLLGTDKNADGALVVFNLRGEEIEGKTVRNLARPNNVDVLQGISTPGGAVDIAVVTERNRHQLRIFSLPDMKPLDRGGLPVFANASESPPMGIALWKRPEDGAIYAVVSAKTGPSYGYLRQYQLILQDDGLFTIHWYVHSVNSVVIKRLKQLRLIVSMGGFIILTKVSVYANIMQILIILMPIWNLH